MTTLEKAAREPSEGARTLANTLWWILGSGGSARQSAITEAAAWIDDYVSKQLLDPSDEVVIAMLQFWHARVSSHIQAQDVRDSLRAAGVKITGKD
jgi:hypothetical protein